MNRYDQICRKYRKKIEAQLEKLKQLKAQKQAIEARERSKQKEQERKDDTRRKILLGSYLIKKMQSNEANKEKKYSWNLMNI